ncbi:MAG: hypothetical protein AAF773_26430 [Cyanobacteria bacterium P01_D01_bin.115]
MNAHENRSWVEGIGESLYFGDLNLKLSPPRSPPGSLAAAQLP